MNLKRLLQTTLLLAIIGPLCTSCESEPENAEEYLFGRWEIVNATRDGQVAQTLSDLFYVFNPDGTMRTNLPLGKAESEFQIEGSTIEQDLGEKTVTYQIESINDSLMTLSTEMRNTQFRFNFRKAASSPVQ